MPASISGHAGVSNSKGKYKGWLLKRATSVSAYLSWTGWRRRFCVLHDDRLEYFINDGDREPRGVLMFGDDSCDVCEGPKVRDGYHSFRIIYGANKSVDFAAPSQEQSKRWQTVISAKIRQCSASRARSKSHSVYKPRASMLIEMEEYGNGTDTDESLTEDDCSDEQQRGMSRLRRGSQNLGNQFGSTNSVIPARFVPILKAFGSKSSLNSDEWNLTKVKDRLRFFETKALVYDAADPSNNHQTANRCYKVNGIANVSSTKMFRLVLDLCTDTRSHYDEWLKNEVVVKVIDDHNDIVRLVAKSTFVQLESGFGHVVGERQFMLHRHWRQDDNGNLEIYYRSTSDAEGDEYHTPNVCCGNVTGMVVRIAPTMVNDGRASCAVTVCAQLDLGGWVWPREAITQAYTELLLETFAKLRDVAEYDAEFDVTAIRNKPKLKANLVAAVGAIRDPSLTSVARRQLPKPSQNEKGTQRLARKKSSASSKNSTAKQAKSGNEKDNQLNYKYDMPTNTYLVPMMKSPKGLSAWWDSGVEKGFWKVRGPNYLTDKVKIPNDVSAMELVQTQWSFFSQPKRNIANDPDELVAKQQTGRKDRPFMLVINFMVPTVGNWVCYFVKRRNVHDETFDRMLDEFVHGTDAHRNSRFKIIPNVVEGSYMAKRGIGSTPAILGKKIDCEYYTGDNWFEICVNVGSSRVAGSLMTLVKSYAKTLVMDLAFLIESQDVSELPERLIGGCRMHYPLMYPVDDMSQYILPEVDGGDASDSQSEFDDKDSDDDGESGDGDEVQQNTSSTRPTSARESFDRLEEMGQIVDSNDDLNKSSTEKLSYDYEQPKNSGILPTDMRPSGVSTYCDAGTSEFGWRVRGPNYLTDKVKVDSQDSAMILVRSQWSFYNEPKKNMLEAPGELVQQQHVGRTDRPFLFVVNFMVPTIGNFVSYFAKRPGLDDPVFDRMLENFVNGTDEERTSKFKLIPGIVEGYLIVRRAVGNKPAILGKKLTVHYFKGDNCFEVCIDVGSSKVAGGLMNIVKGYAKTIVLDMAFLFEGQSEEELPERVLGAIRVKYPYMSLPTD